MMYWVVFALFTTLETFTDVFLAFWFPFYFELKIVMLVWLLSPTTNGSSILYRKFVHPYLMKKEEKIDRVIQEAQQQSYNTVKEMGGKALRYTSNLLMESVMRAPNVMAELVNNGQMALEHRAGAREQNQVETRAGATAVRRTEVVEAPRGVTRHNLDIDMSDAEEGEADVMVNTHEEEVIEEQVEEVVIDPFDLEESEIRSRRREVDALNFSSGDDMDQDPDFKPQPKKGRKGGKKKIASTSKKTTRQSKKSE